VQNANKIKVAFFKGEQKSPMHRFIRWYTKSIYSHVELILPDGKTWVGISPFLTSTVGARKKDPEDCKDNWDYLVFSLSWRKPVRDYQLSQLNKFIDKTTGENYDWIGLLMSNMSPFLVKKKGMWYCSEWIAHALVNARLVMWDEMNIYDTPNLSPGRLYDILHHLSDKE
jgi:hypothetical protein